MNKKIIFASALLCLFLVAGCGESAPQSVSGPAADTSALNFTCTEAPAPEDEPPDHGQSSEIPGQGEEDTPAEKIPMLMLGGELYCDTGEVSSEPRCGMTDGEITSSVEPWERPCEDGQSNFGSGCGWQYGCSEDTVEVSVDGVWRVFQKRSTLRVRYADNWYDAADVSDETLRWLLWFNSLDSDEQMCVSFTPMDLYELCGYPSAEDAAADDH